MGAAWERHAMSESALKTPELNSCNGGREVCSLRKYRIYNDRFRTGQTSASIYCRMFMFWVEFKGLYLELSCVLIIGIFNSAVSTELVISCRVILTRLYTTKWRGVRIKQSVIIASPSRNAVCIWYPGWYSKRVRLLPLCGCHEYARPMDLF